MQLVIKIFNLSVNNLYILSNIALLLNLFTLFSYLFINNRLLITYIIISVIMSMLFKSLT